MKIPKFLQNLLYISLKISKFLRNINFSNVFSTAFAFCQENMMELLLDV